MIRTFTVLIVLGTALAGQSLADSDTAPRQKAVLITGASSGLGRVMAETMAAIGYFVYAGARSDKDLEELSAIENIQGVRLDVNKQDQIDAAVKTISEAGRGLYGLVNNAGVVVVGPLIEIEEEDFDFQMNVNIYGPYRVTKAFAPLIIESKGRIGIIGSISGTLASATDGPYSMTKFAMEAFADSLRDEMKRFDVTVTLIEPGAYRSNIGKTALERLEQSGHSPDDSQFKDVMQESVDWLKLFEKDQGDPAEVAAAAMKAMFDENPKPRYMVVPTQEQAYWTINRAIERMVEQNHDHKFSYDRETLIEMLDAALAKQSRTAAQ